MSVPFSDAVRLAELRLTLVPGVGPRIRRALLARFGGPEAVLAARAAELATVPGVGPKLVARIRSAAELFDLNDELERCRAHGVQLLTESDAAYPRLLREIPDPPGVLFLHGDLQPPDALAVAVVGTRHATRYGLQQAERLAGGLARAGLTVVSGLARGIDAAAHRGALAAGGRTLAVLGSGVLQIYPPEHAELAAMVRDRGVLISEQTTLSPPRSGTFPQRNRLITGLCLGVVVVEAARRSGALISARHALEQGREVFAVPGRVDYPSARGCHRLIRDGAKLVESVDDILEELGPLVEAAPQADGRTIRHPVELSLNAQEQAVLAAIDAEATAIDRVVTRCQLPVERVLATLSALEIRRLVRRISGHYVARN